MASYISIFNRQNYKTNSRSFKVVNMFHVKHLIILEKRFR